MNKTKHTISEYIAQNKLDLDRIMDDFEPYVKTIINNMVGDNLSYEDKEEVLSDTFFILWKNQEKVDTSLEAYVAGVTKNLVKDKCKKKKINYDISDYENIIENYKENFEPTYIDKIDLLERTFCKLKPIDLEIVNRYYYYSKSTKEIANELNISEINVRTRLFRTRNKIRKEIDKGGKNAKRL